MAKGRIQRRTKRDKARIADFRVTGSFERYSGLNTSQLIGFARVTLEYREDTSVGEALQSYSPFSTKLPKLLMYANIRIMK